MDAVRDLVTHKLDERGISMKDASLRQVILRQRPSQVCDTNIQGDSAFVLRGGVRADLTVFGHSDDSATFLSRSDTSNDDRAKQKQRDQNQPTQGRS